MATLSYKSDITRANTITNTVICNNEQQQNQEEKYNDSYYLSYCYYHPTYHKVYFTTIQQELYNKRTMVPIYVYISSFIATSLVIILSFFPFVNVSSLIVCSCCPRYRYYLSHCYWIMTYKHSIHMMIYNISCYLYYFGISLSQSKLSNAFEWLVMQLL